MKLAFVISSLRGGGAERVFVELANEWSQSGVEVYAILFTDSQEPKRYTLHPRIKLIELGIATGGKNRILAFRSFQGIWKLRKKIQSIRPDLVLSFLDKVNITVLLSLLGTRIPCVVSERIDPRKHKIEWIWKILRRGLYPYASQIIVQSERTQTYLKEIWGLNSVVLENPIREIQKNSLIQKKTIWGVGRLVPQKNFSFLIRSFSKIAARYPDWSLAIIGEGPLHEELESLTQKLGVKDQVEFLGWIDQPFENHPLPEIFAMTSEYEGFPMALCEAMVVGVPAICLDCPTGPRELIGSTGSGVLVEEQNEETFALELEKLMLDRDLRQEFSKRGKRTIEKFSVSKVASRWLSHLNAEVT